MIRIASGQAFWGDWPQAPLLQVRSGPIDYLILDYLAEVTIAILAKQHRRDPQAGYARDFVHDIGDQRERDLVFFEYARVEARGISLGTEAMLDSNVIGFCNGGPVTD